MKKMMADGTLWAEQDGDIFSLGLTRAGLEKYGVCFVFVPKVAVGATVEPNQVLASMEGSKCLKPFRAPFPGEVTFVNEELMDTPYLIEQGIKLFSIKGKPHDGVFV